MVVRPDGHVGCVVGLVQGKATVDALEEYFDAFVVRAGPVGSGVCDDDDDDGWGGRREGVRARL